MENHKYLETSLPHTVEDITELNRRFTSQRLSLPHMFIVSPYELRSISGTGMNTDQDHRYKLASMWTKSSPSLPIIYRCKQLAEAALNCINVSLLKADMDIKVITRLITDGNNKTLSFGHFTLKQKLLYFIVGGKLVYFSGFMFSGTMYEAKQNIPVLQI